MCCLTAGPGRMMIDDSYSDFKLKGCMNVCFFYVFCSCLCCIHKFMNDMAPLSSATTGRYVHIAYCKSWLWLRSRTDCCSAVSASCSSITLHLRSSSDFVVGVHAVLINYNQPEAFSLIYLSGENNLPLCLDNGRLLLAWTAPVLWSSKGSKESAVE